MNKNGNETTIEIFQKHRTEIISKMLDNPDENEIYPTTICFEELDNLFLELLRSECIKFAAEYAYKKVTNSDMCAPNVVYEDVEKHYDNTKKE